jgi:MFS family permease
VQSRRFPGALVEGQFRRFVTSTLLFGMAYQLLLLAQGYTLFQFTESTAYLAALGAATGIPQVFTPLLAGHLNDRLPRKHLLLAGSTIMLAVTAAVAAVHGLGRLEPWHILVAGFFHGALLGVDWTSRQAVLPATVSRERLVSGVAIDLGVFNLARVLAPLTGGAVLAAWGGSATYGVIAALFAANVLVVAGLRMTPQVARTGRAAIVRDMREALDAASRDPVIGINLAFTAVNGILLGGIVYLMPAFAKETIATDERGLSWLFAALGVGALAASAWLSVAGVARRAGMSLLVSNLAFAAAGAAFAFAGHIWAALALAVLASLFNTVHISVGAAAIQLASNDELRGRVFGLYEVAWGAFPLGGLLLGLLASVIDLRLALATGAVGVAAFTILVLVTAERVRALRF